MNLNKNKKKKMQQKKSQKSTCRFNDTENDIFLDFDCHGKIPLKW